MHSWSDITKITLHTLKNESAGAVFAYRALYKNLILYVIWHKSSSKCHSLLRHNHDNLLQLSLSPQPSANSFSQFQNPSFAHTFCQVVHCLMHDFPAFITGLISCYWPCLLRPVLGTSPCLLSGCLSCLRGSSVSCDSWTCSGETSWPFLMNFKKKYIFPGTTHCRVPDAGGPPRKSSRYQASFSPFQYLIADGPTSAWTLSLVFLPPVAPPSSCLWVF